jgi:anti-sigma28 factor (negative regulator of flagellin synthesis)
MAAAAEPESTVLSARVECLRRAVRSGQLVVSADPHEMLRSRRRGRLVIDARSVAGALMAAEPEFLGPGADAL